MKQVSVIGAGAWGTALAVALSRAGLAVKLWAREEEVVESIARKRENTPFLPGAVLPDTVQPTGDIKESIAADVIFLVPPAQFARATCGQLASSGLAKSVPLVTCSKGVEQNSLKLMTEVVAETLPNPILVLSGPTFAKEVAQGLPASAALACNDMALCRKIAGVIASESFKIFPIADITGAEIGGAVKNVIAIACGIAEGRGLGDDARAALMTQGLREMKALCLAKGGKAETLLELCGVGDLILTCGSRQSRNMSLGYALGQGRALKDVLAERVSVAEGIASAESVTALAEKYGVDMPVCRTVNDVLSGRTGNEQAIAALIKKS